MYSVDFEEVERLQHQGKWEELTTLVIDAAQRLEKGGADFIVICTNTMHKMAEEVQASISIPLLHIADTTGGKIKEKGLKKVALLGTKFTMEQDFYKGRMEKKFELKVIIPNEAEREIIHSVIYGELCLGKINKSSKEKFKRIIQRLAKEGAEGIVLGCTEIPLLIKQKDVKVPLFDTTMIHAQAAVELALN